jgi:phosphosulfolactate synthase (CoM biosynthesis protein A)
VTNTIAKNIEKAEDNIKRKIKRDEEFEMTDEEAMKDTNIAVRKNTSDTVRTMTDSVRTNAQGIIKGARAIEEEIVGPQTVKVVIRWDTNSERASNYLRSRFIKQ